jgi:hypothetical protein
MEAFSHRFNKFDLFVILIGLVATINFVCRYFITHNDLNAALAFMSLLITAVYAKWSDISSNI